MAETKAERAARARKAEHRATVRARRKRQRANQRERAYNLAKYPIVATMPGPLRATTGQQSGIPQAPGRGHLKPWVRESAARRQREREEAEARG